MAELTALFETTTKQVEPDLDSWRQLEERRRRHTRRRKMGALTVAAAIGAIAALGIVWATTLDRDDGARERTPASIGVKTEIDPGTYLLDLRTGRLRSIEGFNYFSDLDVSPDGTSVAFERGQVVVTDLDGSNERTFESTGTMLPPGAAVSAPRWSPDGRTIVYQGQGPNEEIGNLYSLDVTSGDVTRLTDVPQISSHLWYMSPSYSPDGGSILFTMPRGRCGSCSPPTGRADRQTWHLWSIPSSGGEPTIVLRDAGFGEYSPDGGMIAYTQILKLEDELATFGSLWIANADGSDRRRLATGELVFPRWSPDGTRIAYSADSGGMYVVDVATGDTTRITKTDAWPEWVDDGSLLVPVE
jgi:Tol biopolymer transport system component